MSLAVSLVNHVAVAPAFGVTTPLGVATADPAFPITNIQDVTRPFLPWRSTSTVLHNISIDYGSAKPVDVWALIRANFTGTWQVFADIVPTFNSGSLYSSGALTVGATAALNGRYHASYRPGSTKTFRHNLIQIAEQTPVATPPHAAGAGYFIVGGIWAGPLATVPRDILMDPAFDRPEPVEDLPLPSGGRARSTLGYPYITLGCRRLAEQDAGGLDTQLRQWLALDEQWRQVDHALVMPRAGVPSDAYIMRRVTGFSGTWGKVWSDADLVLEEVVS